jgi:alkanesulfonate monooxygenase SsuD/methylene tetrahydromethanopterin reductase-like flavin-dependent oxidoreductase (luciferase family)
VTSIGAIFRPQLPPERLRSVARAADQAGLDELWLWEDCFFESGLASAAAALAWTDRVRIGVGLLPVPLRNVALTAMELATLHRLFPGRLRVGIGHGVQHWMAQVGANVASPMTLLREYLTGLRALLRGEPVSMDGQFVKLDRVKLEWPPPSPPELLVGGEGPRTLRLAGEFGDGTILTAGTPLEKVRAVRADRDPGHRIVAYLHAATGPTAVERLERERRSLAYESNLDVMVAGDAAAVAQAVARWVDAGADTVVLQPTPDDPDPEGFIRFVASLPR